VRNLLPKISRWKIADNLRRSLFAPSLVLALLAGWLLAPRHAVYWTAVALATFLTPLYWNLQLAVFRLPGPERRVMPWLKDVAMEFIRGHAMALLNLTFLLYDAFVSIDAVARTLWRVYNSQCNLLEWETAAKSETATRGLAPVDIWLEVLPVSAAAIALTVPLLRPAAFPAALPVFALWVGSRGLASWLDQTPAIPVRALSSRDARWLSETGRKICHYFREWSSSATRWLIPDSVNEHGEAVLRLSPTNLGMLLNARIAAVHLGVTSIEEFAGETRKTLSIVLQLQKHRGHLLNWYDISTLDPLPPRFVSSVDSGNLAAALWTLKQAGMKFAAELANADSNGQRVRGQLEDIVAVCDQLVREMDFTFLYNRKRRALSAGYDLSRKMLEPSCYDLLASEARIAVFVAIAKGDIARQAWFQLGRGHIRASVGRVLSSWTGSMFEYLMPAIWMRHHKATITGQSARGAILVHQRYATEKGVPWGISESAYLEEDGRTGYGPFGAPALALNPAKEDKLVTAPYAALLAAQIAPEVAIDNLRRMEELGWSGRYGFYEAVDHSGNGAEAIRSWMAHHQGMSLLSICNLLFDDVIQKYFHSEPHVMAAEALLHERIPPETGAEPEMDSCQATLAVASTPG